MKSKKKLYKTKIDNKYIEIPPKIGIEIDTKADLKNFDNILDETTPISKIFVSTK
jgi:hypothetical protein